jgi:hypothetical protein
MPEEDATVTARFEQVYKVSTNISPVNSSSMGSVTIKNSEGITASEFAYQEQVLVYIEPKEGYVFDVTLTSGSFTNPMIESYFPMPRNDVTLNVTFRLNPGNVYRVAVAGNIEHGSITPETEDRTYLSGAAAGDNVYLNINPAAGYELDRPTLKFLINNLGNGETITTTGYPPVRPSFKVPVMALPTDMINITAAFKLKDLNLTSNRSPTGGGSISFTNKGGGSTAKAQMGDLITVAVTTNTGYRLKSNGVTYSYTGTSGLQTVTLSETSPYSFTMPAYDTTVNAGFDRLYTVTSTVNPSDSAGSVIFRNEDNQEETKFAVDDTVIVETTASTGYTPGNIRVNGGPPITGSSFKMPSGGDVNVTVTFNKIEYTITHLSVANGTLSGPATATFGDEITINWQASPGYELGSLYYNTGSSGNITIPMGTRTFNMPAGNINAY